MKFKGFITALFCFLAVGAQAENSVHLSGQAFLDRLNATAYAYERHPLECQMTTGTGAIYKVDWRFIAAYYANVRSGASVDDGSQHTLVMEYKDKYSEQRKGYITSPSDDSSVAYMFYEGVGLPNFLDEHITVICK